MLSFYKVNVEMKQHYSQIWDSSLSIIAGFGSGITSVMLVGCRLKLFSQVILISPPPPPPPPGLNTE